MGKGKQSKTNVAARKDQRTKQMCPDCGNPIEISQVIMGTGKAKIMKMCCLKNQGFDPKKGNIDAAK